MVESGDHLGTQHVALKTCVQVYLHRFTILKVGRNPMAMPPNALTDLLRDYETPEEMGGALRRGDCLSERGVEDFSGMVALIERTWQAYEETLASKPVGWTGPSHLDVIAGELVNSPYLNAKAGELYYTDTRGA